MIRLLIVDDEETARDRLRRMLVAFPDVQVVGDASSGEQALDQIAELHPDLVLLDIQMPGCSGLEVAACLPRPRPRIVFCTAFDQYAVDAFELHATDYLLKPVSPARLAHALDRVRNTAVSEAEAEVERILRTTRETATRIIVRCGEAYRVLPQREIVHFSSTGGLTRVHTDSRQYVLEPTLNELEDRLNPALFFRISRAAIVNLDRVTEVLPMPGGTADVVLKNGPRLEVSRRRVKELLQRLGGGGIGPPPETQR
jgi:two-component system LytT family response regulator